MKIAYISHHKRPCYEYDWFSKLNFEKIKFIDTDFSSYPKNPSKNIEYCIVNYRENCFLNKFFHSTASVVYYKDFENYLKDVDVVIVLEIFSSLSKQFVNYCNKHNKKVIVLVYELIDNHPIYSIPTHILNKTYCIKNSDLFICISNKAKEHLIKLGAETSKVKVVYPGINLDVFKPEYSKRDSNRIIFIGGLGYHKGIDLVLLLYKKLVSLFPNQEMWIIGDGLYKEKVVELSKQYPNFKYFGRIDNKKLPDYLNLCGIYILPCRDSYKLGQKVGSEQFGFSLVEAMACGLIIVSTKCGAIPEIITKNNIICEQNNFDELYDEINNLLKNYNKYVNTVYINVGIVKEKYDLEKQSLALATLIKGLIKKNA